MTKTEDTQAMNPATLSGGPADRSMTPAMKGARALGWFSLALGAVELVAPGRLGRAIGLGDRTGLLRACGAREVAAGIGAHSVNPVPAMWSRVAGDLVDLGTLAVALRRDDSEQRASLADAPEGETRLTPEQSRRNTWIAVAAVAGVTALDVLVASKLSAERAEGKGARRDYSDRSGFPRGVEASRGAAKAGNEMTDKPGSESRVPYIQMGSDTPDEQKPAIGMGGQTVRAGSGASGGSASADVSIGATSDLTPPAGLEEKMGKAVPEPVAYTPT